MKERLLKYIVCPECKAELKIEIKEKEKDEIKTGKLTCKNKHSFEITNFIPRFVKQRTQVRDSFGDKWKFLPSKGEKSFAKTFKVLRKWTDERFGYIGHEKEIFENKKMIMDAGCGLAHHSLHFSKYNTKGEIFAVDIADCIDEAYENVKNTSNVHVIQADLMKPPFLDGTFDYIFSEGVIHHTPNPKQTFSTLAKLLKKAGEIAIYVYNKKAVLREYSDDYIRDKAGKLSFEECYKRMIPITKLGKVLTELKAEVDVPEDIPELEIKKGKYDIQRFIYWNFLKCFWNNEMSFEENNITNVDWFHPQYAFRQTPEEVREWYKNNKLKIIHENIEESGITVRGIKE